MKQSIDNKLGEIIFRKKIVEQQTEDKIYFKDEFNSREIEQIISDRMKDTYTDIKLLIDQQTTISPYIEIGAERGQRSLVLENDLNASGAAIDISFDMLKSCAYYSSKYGKSKLPLRVCTDAYNLPFKSNSVPFVFCYQTLHHFPDPTPIISEMFRVLTKGGVFLFDEEPYKKAIHFAIYKKRYKLYSLKERNKNVVSKILDYFFAEVTCNETDHGVVENEDISLGTWKNALKVFEIRNVKLDSVKLFKVNLFSRNYFKLFPAYLFGGSISGICKKSGIMELSDNKISDELICPSCRLEENENVLQCEMEYYFCSNCSRKYPVVDDVLILFTDDLFRKLYPQFRASV
jgi:SAM-dependent methyltransferase